MLVDLRKVPVEGQAIDHAVSLADEGTRRLEFRLAEPARVIGRISRTDDDKRAFRLTGRLAADVELTCGRCLIPFETELRENLDLHYLPQSKNVARAGEDDRGLGEDELLVAFYRDDQLDLSHMAWEQIVLALPMKPLCKIDCEGLCPDCGVNFNAASCSCVQDDTDPRWQALNDLIDS